MLVLQKALVRALESVGNFSNLYFEVLTRHSMLWNSFPNLLSYCAYIGEAKTFAQFIIVFRL